MKKILTYDIGGTFIKYAVFTSDGIMLYKDKFKTLRGQDFMGALLEHVLSMTKAHEDLGAISIGIPGIVKGDAVVHAANLEVHDVPVRKLVHDGTNIPTYLTNDAQLAAFGEKVYGAAKAYHSFMLVTIGTGIGSGLVLEGRIFEGPRGGFGELGHTVIHPEGRQCHCGNKGCLEMYGSMKGILANYHEITGCETTMDSFIESTDDARAKALEVAAKTLGLSIANVITLLDLECVVVGGGISANEFLVDRIDYWVNEYVMPSTKPIRIVRATSGNDAALYGAYAIAEHNGFK